MCSRPRQNVNLGTFTFSSRATTAKKCTKKSVMHVQSCFANLNLFCFLAVLVAVAVALYRELR